MSSEHIPPCIMDGIEREIDAELMREKREKAKVKAKLDILDTETTINAYLYEVEALGVLENVADDLHNLEDTLRLIVGTPKDRTPITEVTRYGEW